MNIVHSVKKALLIAAAAFLASGCARQQLLCEIPEYYLAMPTNQIEEEISLLKKKLGTKPAGSRNSLTPEGHYYLTLLYSHHNNPRPNYGKALSSLDHYVSSLPPESRVHEIYYLKNLLSRLEGFIQIKMEYIDLQGEQIALEKDYLELEKNHAELRRQLDHLVQEHQATKKTIERLKRLDIKLEQKKRKIK